MNTFALILGTAIQAQIPSHKEDGALTIHVKGDLTGGEVILEADDLDVTLDDVDVKVAVGLSLNQPMHLQSMTARVCLVKHDATRYTYTTHLRSRHDQNL